MKIKSFTKIISGILCAALTMQIGWGVTIEKVNAAGKLIPVSYGETRSTLSITTDSADPIDFYIGTNEDGKVEISSSDDPYVHEYSPFDEISVSGSAQLHIQGNLKTFLSFSSANASIEIPEGSTFTSITNEGRELCGRGNYLTISGTYICDTFRLSDIYTTDTITINDGTIKATNIIFDYYTFQNSNFTFTSTSGATYIVETSFSKENDEDLAGLVIAKPYTTIKSDGGTFKLRVGSLETLVSGEVDQTAAEFFDDPEIELNGISDLYYGQDYDFTDLISVADGYNKSLAYLEYSSDYSNFTTEKPTAQSSYYVRAVAPDYGSYLGTTSELKHYTIDYLPFREILPVGSKTYDSVSGIVNGKYVAGDLVLKMPDGILIKGYSFDSGDFSNTITLTPDDVLIDGRVNQDSLIQLRRASDNATTNGNIALVDVYPDISNLVYDLYDPYVDVQFVDGREMSIEDGMLTGDNVVIGIGDENLDKIYINGELYDYEEIEEGYVELELNSTVGKATEYSIKATDLAGRSTTLDFTLFPNTADADISVSVPGTIYAGDNYAVDVKTNSDGEVSLQYKDASTNTVLSTKPTSAGKYTVTATAEETDFYFEVSNSTSYTIIKRVPDTVITVPDVITIDSDYTIGVDTDSDGDVTYQYFNKNNTTYPINKPTTAGEYTVTVRTTETSKYYASAASAVFTISKRSPNVSLGVGTPYAGTTYSPTFYSNSDAADRAVFEYKEKNADDSKYSTTLPTAYGEYVVRVTIPETAEFAKTIVTADYRIIYLAAPQTAYVIEGQSGKNNYFISDVELKAPTGYSISAVYGGPYTASIPYKDGVTSVYLKRTSDGALTSGIPITNAPRVDKNAPSISAKTGTITPGAVMYVSDFTLNVSDSNLRSLKVNGEPIDLANYKNGYTLTLNPGYGSQTYKIMAEDEAGNVTTIEFTLKAEWLKDKVIIPDVVLPLEGNESYNLGDGYWLVTRNTPEGPVTDKTVYSGNMPFYVPEGGEYTFTKVT